MMSALRLGKYRLESAWTATRNSTIKSWVRYGHRYLGRSLVMRNSSCWVDLATSSWAAVAVTQSAAGSVGGTDGGLHIEPMTRRRAAWIALMPIRSAAISLSLIHISEPTRLGMIS